MDRLGGRPALLRTGLVLLAALLLAFMAARVAAVRYWGRTLPVRALALWPSHPVPRVAATMGAIGSAAASGRPPSDQVLAQVAAVARADPLGAEPLLVAGTQALSAGDFRRAERLLLGARKRDPRGLATRFLLADLYLRTGRVERAVDEVTVLARLVPGGLEPLAPALAQYAKQPGASARLAAALNADQRLRDAVLLNLANDPANAPLILRLAGPAMQAPVGTESPAWQARLIQAMVDRREYRAAHRLWSQLSPGASSGRPGLFNPSFASGGPPPPFNWSYGSGGAGVAEPTSAGTLQLIFYGRDKVVLAAQTLVLNPGRYRLEGTVSGTTATGSPLTWSITCLPAGPEIARSPLARGIASLAFAVPASGCAAQRLEIGGSASEMPGTVEATLGRLQLTAEGQE